MDEEEFNMKRTNTILYLVVPCYNEEEVLHKSAAVLLDKLDRLIQAGTISDKSKILFINDGSKDSTWQIIYELTRQNSKYAGLSFSRNYGHQSAILAGMMAARSKADAVVTIDADLQQDIEALDQFLECYQNGCEIVYGVRNDRDTDGFFKKTTAGLFYKLMHVLGCQTITNHADYRLMSKKALDALSEFHETNLFLRGLIPTMGFQSDIVYFLYRGLGKWCGCCRLDDNGGFDLSDWRYYTFIPGNYWGIYRENLYGKQRTSAVYRGFHDPAGCRG